MKKLAGTYLYRAYDRKEIRYMPLSMKILFIF